MLQYQQTQHWEHIQNFHSVTHYQRLNMIIN